jgi:hypothetical protein
MSKKQKKSHIVEALISTIGLASFVAGLFALRSNNLTMLKYFEAVNKADESGNGVDKALRDLQDYVSRHMNTTLSTSNQKPVVLKESYGRYVAKYQAEEQAVRTKTAEVNAAAQKECERQFPAGASSRRLPCVKAYVQTNAVSMTLAPADTSYYKYDFVSPKVSLDAAGIFLMLAFGCLFTLIARVVSRRIAYFFAA